MFPLPCLLLSLHPCSLAERRPSRHLPQPRCLSSLLPPPLPRPLSPPPPPPPHRVRVSGSSTSVEEREQFFDAAKQAWLRGHSAVVAMAASGVGEVAWAQYDAWLQAVATKWRARADTVACAVSGQAARLYAAACAARARGDSERLLGSVLPGLPKPSWRSVLAVLADGKRLSVQRTGAVCSFAAAPAAASATSSFKFVGSLGCAPLLLLLLLLLSNSLAQLGVVLPLCDSLVWCEGGVVESWHGVVMVDC